MESSAFRPISVSERPSDGAFCPGLIWGCPFGAEDCSALSGREILGDSFPRATARLAELALPLPWADMGLPLQGGRIGSMIGAVSGANGAAVASVGWP